MKVQPPALKCAGGFLYKKGTLCSKCKQLIAVVYIAKFVVNIAKLEILLLQKLLSLCKNGKFLCKKYMKTQEKR